MSNQKETLAIYPLEGYAAPVSFALGSLEWERKKTIELVSELSDDQLELTKEGAPNSIGTLLYHVAIIELDWLYAEILEQDIPKPYFSLFPLDHRDEAGKLSVITGMPLAEHLNRLEVVRHDMLEKLKGITEDDFYKLRNFPPYDVNPAWVLYHLLEHEAKHGEQMSFLLRQFA